MKGVFLPWPRMDKKTLSILSNSFFFVINIFWSKTGPMSGKWLDSWNDFSKNDGDMMFMSWNYLILNDITYLIPPLLKCLVSIANPSSMGQEVRVWCLWTMMTWAPLGKDNSLWHYMCWHVELWVGSLWETGHFYIWIDIKLHE